MKLHETERLCSFLCCFLWNNFFDGRIEEEKLHGFRFWLLENATGMVALNPKIVVPFAYQSKTSGIGDESTHEVIGYRRSFALDRLTGDILLCFNGCDYQTTV